MTNCEIGFNVGGYITSRGVRQRFSLFGFDSITPVVRAALLQLSRAAATFGFLSRFIEINRCFPPALATDFCVVLFQNPKFRRLPPAVAGRLLDGFTLATTGFDPAFVGRGLPSLTHWCYIRLPPLFGWHDYKRLSA